MARRPRQREFFDFSFAQRSVLGDPRVGPQWEGGLRTQTFRVLARRGLIDGVDRGYRSRLTPADTPLDLALRLMPLPWYLRQPFGSPRLPPPERRDRRDGGRAGRHKPDLARGWTRAFGRASLLDEAALRRCPALRTVCGVVARRLDLGTILLERFGWLVMGRSVRVSEKALLAWEQRHTRLPAELLGKALDAVEPKRGRK